MQTKSRDHFKSGLYFLYLRTGMPVAKDELRNQLSKTKASLEQTPAHAFKVIKMNSTYLEIVDRSFDVYGKTLTSWLIVGTVPLVALNYWIYKLLILYINSGRGLFVAIIFFIFLFGFILVAYPSFKSVYKKEIKSYTYRPIRFNRENGKVYAFDDEGTTHVADWDKMVFVTQKVPTYLSPEKHEIQGFMLDEKGNIRHIVRFGLGSEKNASLAQWEFVRHYMEQGPEQYVVDPQKLNNMLYKLESYHLVYCLDIDQKRETKAQTKEFIRLNNLSLFHFLSKPIFGLMYVFRRIMMHYAKVPSWPKWVDEECSINQNDVYIITAEKNIDIYTRLPELRKYS